MKLSYQRNSQKQTALLLRLTKTASYMIFDLSFSSTLMYMGRYWSPDFKGIVNIVKKTELFIYLILFSLFFFADLYHRTKP